MKCDDAHDQKRGAFVRLKHSLQLLASPSGIQLRILPSYVCRADELAYEFDHWHEVVTRTYKDALTSQQKWAIDAIHEKFQRMYQDSEIWTDEAVGSSPDWQAVRDLASETLKTFGWPSEVPPSYEHEYVSPDKPSTSKGNPNALNNN